MNRDVFYFSVQCLCINRAWRGAARVAARSGWLPALAGLSASPCADDAAEGATSQKQHELSYVNSK